MSMEYGYERKGIDYELIISLLMISSGTLLLLSAFGLLKL